MDIILFIILVIAILFIVFAVMMNTKKKVLPVISVDEEQRELLSRNVPFYQQLSTELKKGI